MLFELARRLQPGRGPASSFDGEIIDRPIRLADGSRMTGSPPDCSMRSTSSSILAESTRLTREKMDSAKGSPFRQKSHTK